MADSGTSGDRARAAAATQDSSHRMLHMLLDVVLRSGRWREHEVARALELATPPAAVFRVRGRSQWNRAWSTAFGAPERPPKAIRPLLALAARIRPRPYVMPLELSNAHVVATVQYLGTAHAALVTLGEPGDDLRAAKPSLRLDRAFLSTVAHSLRAPLAAMLLWERVLRDDAADPSLRREALDAIHESTTKQLRMITQLVDLARVETGALTLVYRDVDVTRLAIAAVEAARPGAAAGAIAMAHLSTADHHSIVRGDAAQLRRVLDELLVEALRIAPAGATLVIATAERPAEWTLDLRITSKAIASNPVPKLAREDDGMGLAICRRIVELHRGTLEIASSRTGKDAGFALTFPLASAIALPTRRLDGVRILVIDNDASVARALNRVLARVGAVVECAPSTRRARAHIATFRPHVLVSDIGLPDEDGCTFVRRLRADGVQLPAIACTAFASPRDRSEALRAGFDVHLEKPVQVGELVDTVRSLVVERPSDRVLRDRTRTRGGGGTSGA